MKTLEDAQNALEYIKANAYVNDDESCTVPSHVMDFIDNALAECKSALAEIEKCEPVKREGWKLVPIEPTDDMCIKAREITGISANAAHHVFLAMLSAAPTDNEHDLPAVSIARGLL